MTFQNFKLSRILYQMLSGVRDFSAFVRTDPKQSYYNMSSSSSTLPVTTSALIPLPLLLSGPILFASISLMLTPQFRRSRAWNKTCPCNISYSNNNQRKHGWVQVSRCIPTSYTIQQKRRQPKRWSIHHTTKTSAKARVHVSVVAGPSSNNNALCLCFVLCHRAGSIYQAGYKTMSASGSF